MAGGDEAMEREMITSERLRLAQASVVKVWRRLWLGAGPIQAAMETVALALVFTTALVFLTPTPTTTTLPYWLPLLVLFDGPGCSLWLAFRLRMRQDRWLLGALTDAAIGLPVSIMLGAIVSTGILSLAPASFQLSRFLTLQLAFHGALPYLIAVLVGLNLAFIVPRLALRIWL